MSGESIRGGIGGADYSYAYTNSINVEQKVKSETPKIEASDTQRVSPSKNTDDSKKIQTPDKADNEKTIYEDELEEQKRVEEERKREERVKRESERLKELSEELNKRMNSFSENIKFGINDKADSLIVNVIEDNNERKIKELSREDAEKLFKRLDYVLGVLFDSRG